MHRMYIVGYRRDRSKHRSSPLGMLSEGSINNYSDVVVINKEWKKVLRVWKITIREVKTAARLGA